MAARTILIVEDDPVARQVLEKALRADGFDVAVAADTLSAVTQTRARRPVLIVLDLGLPAGGGFTAIDRIRLRPDLAGIPILIVSGQDPSVNRPRALEAGAAGYLEKPAGPEEVLREVHRILGDPAG